jgi:hypothetical protein
MPDLDDAAIAASFPHKPVTVVPQAATAGLPVPDAWQDIIAATTGTARAAATRRLWPAPLLHLIPKFAQVLTDRLIDVRLVSIEGDLALAYLVDDASAGRVVTWIGYDPATFGTPPPFWEVFPEPLTDFLREVHAGFTSQDTYSFGVTRPRYMATIADNANSPEGIPFWDEIQPYPSTRLLQISAQGPGMLYCLSPDLPAEHLAIADEAEIDVVEFWPAIDDLLMDRFLAQD